MNSRVRSHALWISVSLFPAAVPCIAQCSAQLSAADGPPVPVRTGGQLFVSGPYGSLPHTGSVDHYDPSTGAWSVLDLSMTRFGFASTGAEGIALFAGGYRFDGVSWLVSDRVDLYETLAGAWTTAALSQARADVTAATVGSKALFAGGYGVNDLDVCSARVDLFDAVTGTWTTADLSQPRNGMSVAVVDDRVLFAGGWTDGSAGTGQVMSAVVDIFDAATGQWSSANLTQARMGMVATTVGSTALFSGGASATSPAWVLSDVVDLFDGSSGLWSSATLSSPRVRLAATSVAGKAYFAGGMTPDPINPPFIVLTDAIDVFDALTSTWSLAHLSEPRFDVGAVAFGDRAWFAGGSVGQHAPLSVVDVLDTATGAWSVQSLGVARGAVAAVALEDRVVFAGGTVSCGSHPGPSPAGFGVGEVRRFQVVYRDAASPCGSGFNASNGLEVEFTH